MRRYDYHAMRAEIDAKAMAVRRQAGMGIPKDQPHDDEHWDMQLRIDRANWERAVATGRLEILGLRRFRLNAPLT